MSPLGPAAQDAFDVELRRILDAGLDKAVALVRRQRAALDALAEQLLAEETLEGDDLARLLPKPAVVRRKSAS
jgi:cell division protease FtsH